MSKQQHYVYQPTPQGPPPPGAYEPAHTAYPPSYDPEMGYGKVDENMGDSYAAFMEKEVRLGFIRKVFFIVAAQLFVTFGAAFAMNSNDTLKMYCAQNSWPFWLSIPLVVGGMVGLLCCGDMHRKFPHNYALLFLFTIGESFMVGMATMQYETDIFLQAFALTGVMVLGLVCYAFQTKYDFTTSGGVLFSCLLALLGFSFMLIFFGTNNIFRLVISSIGALIFCCYIVFDVQILMDGKRCQLSPDDYILAALNLYLDILNLFMYILQILNEVQR